MATKKNAVFEFGGYHFKPYRKFKKGEIERRYSNDSREWKIDFRYAMRKMKRDVSLGASTHGWQKVNYSHKAFYEASGKSTYDIFLCVENGRLYVPCEEELLIYDVKK